MKCVKYKNGTVKRVSDDVAARAVKKGEATYVSKSEWRENGRQR